MRQINKEKLNRILEKHKLWLNCEEGGEKADLRGVDLRNADLRGVNLRDALVDYADLRFANLRGIDLRDANLRGVNLREALVDYADLKFANLRGADLRGIDLRDADLGVARLDGADLRNADLREAHLDGADLRGADLRNADLREAHLVCAYLNGADLTEANLTGTNLNCANLRGACMDAAYPPIACPEKGSFIGFKKAVPNDYAGGEGRHVIVKLEILEDALRSSSTTRKCRCSKAKVISLTTIDGHPFPENSCTSFHDYKFKYEVGKIVEVKDFDTNRWNECAPGIHFFLTREEAVNY